MPYNSVPIKIYMVFTVILVVFGLLFYALYDKIPFFKKHRTIIAILFGAAVLILCAIGELTFRD